jgi:hypothetical protein
VTKRMTSKADVDPELERQLKKAAEGDVVDAVYTLRAPKGKEFLDADETNKLVHRILADAGVKAENLKVFGNIQSFAATTSPESVRSLLQHDAVAAAVANAQTEDMTIEPTPSQPPSIRKGKRGSDSL